MTLFGNCKDVGERPFRGNRRITEKMNYNVLEKRKKYTVKIEIITLRKNVITKMEMQNRGNVTSKSTASISLR